LVHKNGGSGGRRRVAIYCRVSTLDQDVARQERHLLAHAERAGYEVVGAYEETLSGIRKARGKQPVERARVMALAQRREIDVVLVTELTRYEFSGLIRVYEATSLLDLPKTRSGMLTSLTSFSARDGGAGFPRADPARADVSPPGTRTDPAARGGSTRLEPLGEQQLDGLHPLSRARGVQRHVAGVRGLYGFPEPPAGRPFSAVPSGTVPAGEEGSWRVARSSGSG
jgi:hypothetical protein